MHSTGIAIPARSCTLHTSRCKVVDINHDDDDHEEIIGEVDVEVKVNSSASLSGSESARSGFQAISIDRTSERASSKQIESGL